MVQEVGDAAIRRRSKPGRFPFGVQPSAQTSVQRRQIYLRVDVPLLLVTITLAIFGLLMVYSASWDYSMRLGFAPIYFFQRQIIWMVLGAMLAVFLTFFNYHFWQKLAVPAMAVTVLALIGVLFVKEIRNGAMRTLMGGSVQPSELAKLVIIIYLAVWLFSKREQLRDVSLGLIPLASILGILGGLIIIQPDLSAVVTIFLLGGVLFFLAGGDLKQITILVAVAVLVGLLVVQINPTGSVRVEGFLPGLKDPTLAPYHVRRSLEAFVKGGWFGVGIGRADTKLTGLPVPPTDSIFAVVGEEVGLIGSAALVGLYSLFLWRGLEIARRAPDGLGALLAAGLSLWIAIEAFVNMAVMVNLLPFAGNALPFISAGGSNLLVSLAAVGILLNISRLSTQTKEREERTFSAVVDLRRRDRRRRVSRPVRSTDVES
jgi:cell division protein FtsW